MEVNSGGHFLRGGEPSHPQRTMDRTLARSQRHPPASSAFKARTPIRLRSRVPTQSAAHRPAGSRRPSRNLLAERELRSSRGPPLRLASRLLVRVSDCVDVWPAARILEHRLGAVRSLADRRVTLRPFDETTTFGSGNGVRILLRVGSATALTTPQCGLCASQRTAMPDNPMDRARCGARLTIRTLWALSPLTVLAFRAVAGGSVPNPWEARGWMISSATNPCHA